MNLHPYTIEKLAADHRKMLLKEAETYRRIQQTGIGEYDWVWRFTRQAECNFGSLLIRLGKWLERCNTSVLVSADQQLPAENQEPCMAC